MNTIRLHALCSLRRGIIANRAFLEASKATERITYFMTSQNSHNNDKTRFVPSHCASAYSTLNDNNNNNNNNNNKNKPFKSLFACYSPSSTNASVVASNKGVSLLNSKSTAPLYPKRKLVIGQAHFASTVPASTEAYGSSSSSKSTPSAIATAACQDPVEVYISVQEALNNLEDRGTEIGEVVTEDYDEDDEDDHYHYGAEKKEEKKKTSAKKTPDDLAKQLESITEYSFAIGGHYEIGDELRLYIGKLRFVCAKGNEGKEAEAILRLCDPAPFGDLRTQTTVLDPSVRVAYEATSDKFKLLEERQSRTTTATKKKRPGFLDDIACYIQDHLMGTPFNLVPYKLNVYSEGGFFLPHVDTPTSPMMLGTLVVALPYEHSGGELIVTHRGMMKTFDFAPKSADRTVQWAAFFGDCVHEVRPITSGKRITVTYSIVGTPSAPLRPSPSNDSPCRDFTAGTCAPDLQHKQLQAAVRIVKKIIKEDGKLGVLMTHRYTLTGVEGNEGLKGLDRAFYDALEATGKYSLHVVPVVFKRYKEKYEEEGLGMTLDRKVYLLSQDHIEYLRGSSSSANKKPENPVGTGIRFVEVGNYKGSLLSRIHHPGAYYTGNEALPETDLALYFNAALIILTKDQQQQQQQQQ